MKNLLVIFGGVSCEHEVSVITGVMTANSLSAKYNVYPIYVDERGEWHTGDNLKNLNWYKTKNFDSVVKVTVNAGDDTLYRLKNGKLKKICRADAAINCSHGLNGEDGTLAGLMKLSNIAFASPEMFSSSLSMDKYYTKLVLKGIGVDTLPYVKLNRDNYIKRGELAEKYVSKTLDYPVIVKPANLGSSIGISVAKSEKDLKKSLEYAFRYDEKAIVETALTNFREINCACVKVCGRYVVSECEEPRFSGDILGFDDKYGGNREVAFPAEIGEKLSRKIKEITAYVYRKLEFTGVIRIDFLLDGEKIYVNEINSVPGSLAYYLFADDTSGFATILSEVIEESMEKQKSRKANEYVYKSGILNLDGAKLRK